METDDYPTCARTYATLRIYHDGDSPHEVSRILELEPSSFQIKGAEWKRRDQTRTYPLSGWFLCSDEKIESYDTSKHLTWLLEKIAGKKAELDQLRSAGWRMDISCFWDSSWGHGGPTVHPPISKILGNLEIPVWFDVYFTGAMGWTQSDKQACSIKADKA